MNYDIEDARVISLTDIISSDALPEVLERVQDIARTMLPVTGPTEIDALPEGDNFYLTASNEIVFSYQPYEVASYAQGEIQIPVPAYLIASSLTPLGNKLLLN
ncbi:MAG: RsiV family protein [Muribaculaceae bacterium]|nr:RsiV family protein [Muribaculaceae bacterium]